LLSGTSCQPESHAIATSSGARSRPRHKLTLEAQVHRRVILEISTNTWCVNQSVDAKRIKQALRSNTAELQQTRSIDRTRCHDDVLRSDEPGVVRRVTAVDLNSSRSGAVAVEDGLSTVVPHEQMQVGAIADGLVVGCARRRSFARDAADSLRGPDQAGVIAVCSIAGVGGIQVGDPGLSFEFWYR